MKSLRRQRSRVGVISHNGGYLGDSIPVASGDYNPSERRHQSDAGNVSLRSCRLRGDERLRSGLLGSGLEPGRLPMGLPFVVFAGLNKVFVA